MTEKYLSLKEREPEEGELCEVQLEGVRGAHRLYWRPRRGRRSYLGMWSTEPGAVGQRAFRSDFWRSVGGSAGSRMLDEPSLSSMRRTEVRLLRKLKEVRRWGAERLERLYKLYGPKQVYVVDHQPKRIELGKARGTYKLVRV